MLAAFDWPLTIQVTATVFTAIAAVAAAYAAKASRDAIRDARAASRLARVEELHETLSTMRSLLDATHYRDFDNLRPSLGRLLAIIDDPLPRTRQLWRDSELTGDVSEIEMLCERVLEEVRGALRPGSPRSTATSNER